MIRVRIIRTHSHFYSHFGFCVASKIRNAADLLGKVRSGAGEGNRTLVIIPYHFAYDFR
jgi:hypothetical protein